MNSPGAMWSVVTCHFLVQATTVPPWMLLGFQMLLHLWPGSPSTQLPESVHVPPLPGSLMHLPFYLEKMHLSVHLPGPVLGRHFFSATCPSPFSILFKSYLFIFVCLLILHACMYVCIPRAFVAWCPWRPEEDTGSPAAGDADGSELPCGIQTRS